MSPDDNEVRRLQKWKAEAIQVLDGWDEIYEALGSPGKVGQSKAAAVRAEVKALPARVLREAADAFQSADEGWGDTADPVKWLRDRADGLDA